MSRAAAVFCILLVFLPGCAADKAANGLADKAANGALDKTAAYQALVAAAKQGKEPVDWQALRFAYADTPDFDVFDAKTAAPRKKMYEAYNAGDFASALQQATQILDRAYVDIDAHMVSEFALRKLGDPARAEGHHAAAMGLAKSILTGDGLTPATAFTVISVSEEYAVLRVVGVKSKGQSLIQDGGHLYDKLDTVDRDGKERSVFFRIDRVMAAEAAALKKKQ